MSDVVTLAEELAERFAARAAGYDEHASFPERDIEEIRASGLCGLMVPSSLGGLGGTFEDYARVAIALARGNASTALLFNMHASVTGALAGVPEDVARGLGAPDSFFAARDRVLAAAASGSMYGVAITEREAGSRLSALRTSYRRSTLGFRIEGEKSVCSGAGHLDAYLVAARGGEADDVSYFLVPHGEGLEVARTWDPLGMRATASNALRIDVEVGEDALVGVEGIAITLAYAMPQWLVASYAAVYSGLALAAMDEATRYVRERTVAGRPGGLATLPAVRSRLGRAEASAEAVRLALLDAARLVDLRPGEPATNRAVYRAKLLAGDTAMEVSASLAEACGLGALRRGSALERILRDARSGALMPPSSDVAAEVLGADLLGFPAGTDGGPQPW